MRKGGKMNIVKLGKKMTKEINKELEDVECEVVDGNKFLFTKQQMIKYNKKLLRAVMRVIVANTKGKLT